MTNTKYCYCEKCNKTIENDQFYQSNNLEKYPNGRLKQCKKIVLQKIQILIILKPIYGFYKNVMCHMIHIYGKK